MRPDDIERALREDDAILPSPGFAARVMRAVREEAEDLGAIRFPWMRIIPGLVVCVAAIVVGLVSGKPAFDSGLVEASSAVSRAISSTAVVATLAPLLGSWILVRFALRLAGYRD